MSDARPLAGILVLDVSRMLPGAVLARTLSDLGARVVKIEDPSGGDPMRQVPPFDAPGVSAAFAAFYRGAESVCLDLRSPEGSADLRRLAKHADVLVESFRPGTMARWGLAPERLRELNPVLVTCSLPGFGDEEPWAAQPVHDLNLTALSGALREMGEGVPRIQLADVTAGLLAATSILAALLSRHRSGHGLHVEQPLATGPLPFLTVRYAEGAAARDEPTPPNATSGVADLLSGHVPCYRTYRCGDGRELAVGCLEPKFWVDLVDALDLAALAGDGLDRGERGRTAARRVEERLLERPAGEWVARLAERRLPVTLVRTPEEATTDSYYGTPGRLSTYLARSVGSRPESPAPALGEGTERVFREFGVTK